MKGGNLKSSNTTDEEGRTLQDINFNADGTISSKEVCQYDGKISACKKRECLSYNGNNVLVKKEVFDHQTKRKETTDYFNSGKIKSLKIEEDAYRPVAKFAYTRYRHVQEDSYKEDGSCHKQILQWFNESGGGSIGKPLESANYSTDGKLIDKWVYKYDDKGNELESIKYDAGEKLTAKYIYKNDENGNRLEDAGYDADGKMFYKTVYKNDDKGKKLEGPGYDADGKMRYKDVYTYDDKGKPTATRYDADGKPIDKDVHKFDEVTTMYGADMKVIGKYVSSYDDKRKKLEETHYDANEKMLYKDVYKNNAKGKVMEIIRTKPDGTTQYIMKNGKYIK